MPESQCMMEKSLEWKTNDLVDVPDCLIIHLSEYILFPV